MEFLGLGALAEQGQELLSSDPGELISQGTELLQDPVGTLAENLLPEEVNTVVDALSGE